MTKKPSMDDVARLAGVSRTTVSYVLNNVTSMHISEDTRQRVLRSARDLDYHPNASARSLARRQTLTLGLVLCLSPGRLIADAFLLEVIYGITSVTVSAGFRLLVETVEDQTHPNGYIDLVRGAHVNGMILAGTRADDPQLSWLRASNFPVVLWGKIPECDLPFVDVDNVSAAQRAMEHLLALGHRRIAFITNAPLRNPESADRLQGYRAALQANYLPYDDSLVRYGDYQERSGFESMQSLLALPERPSAVFVASDVVALGALRAVISTGLRVPQDMALVGFDDIQLAQYVVPSLTTIRVPAREIGAASARMLLHIIDTGQRPPSALLETELVVRESCGAQALLQEQ